MGLNDTLKVLSDPTRRRILEELRSGPKSAGELVALFEASGASISYHLKLLKQADLIRERKEKNFIFYSLNTTIFEEVLSWISSLTKD